jgi:hypothetical protein
MSYDRYIAWRRLIRNGWRGREQMSPTEQVEWDALGTKRVSVPDAEEARRLYPATGRVRGHQAGI